jgi:hypothetical protein
MRQDHVFLPQNVRQKNVDDMRRKTSIYVRFAVRTFCGVTINALRIDIYFLSSLEMS